MEEITFAARLEPMGPKGSWVFVYLPRKASEALGSRGRVAVVGTINGFPFRSSAFPTGDGTHQVAVNKAMQTGAKAKPGDKVEIALRVDTAPRTVEVPADLKKALAESKMAKANFDKLAWSHRKAYVDWILEAKRPETRARRIAEALRRLGKGQGYYE